MFCKEKESVIIAGSEPKGKIGSVLVVGAGISGIQTSLDLAESGFFVHLVERSSAIGGTMPMLDKTFPTHDCSICILSPKLVECGRHLNIRTYTRADLIDVQGEAGDFKVRLACLPRFVDPVKCKNCGQCAEVCPNHGANEFNQGLDQRSAIYKLYPQAFPDAYVIDQDSCKRCRACQRICPVGAIDLDEKEEVLELEVGAVILSPGFEKINPHSLLSYGYGRFPNVLTSIEFERILSSGGPFRGDLVRPYDHRQPEKIAWIQCAGSRSVLDGRGYCSSVCCRYAIKEAIMAKEHSSRPDLETVIFFMDIRAYSKGLEKYYTTARDVRGVRFIRSRISEVVEIQDERKNLLLRYYEPGVGTCAEEFDLVVLSLGFQPSAKAVELCQGLHVDLNQYGFGEPEPLSGVETSKQGIYMAGAFAGPQCISESVTQAIAASGSAGSSLATARGTLVREKTFPPEKSTKGEIPRIGVFVCHCGTNIGQVVRVADVVESARQLPYVAYACEHLHACSQDSQTSIREAIDQYGLNRVVIASCSPATHGPLFQETVQEAGLNKYLCEMANIRDQCAWVHKTAPGEATKKARELVRMKVVKLAMQNPIRQISVSLTRSCLVVGGGLSGMTCALSLATKAGYEVHLVEKSDALGGLCRRIRQGFRGEDVQALISDLTGRVMSNPLIRTYLSTGPRESCGSAGNFITTLSDGTQIRHGATIIAAGGREYEPIGEYLYGQNDRVMTYLEMEEALARGDERMRQSNDRQIKDVVLITCVGSREPDRPYCSRICCHKSVKLALTLKGSYPGVNIYVLYRDIRTYGFMEDKYREARVKGVTFIRYEAENKPAVEQTASGSIRIAVIDHILKQPLIIEPDLVGLAAAVLPAEDSTKLSQIFKIPLDEHGFFHEAHMKLRPVDCASMGIFLAGVAHGPKNLEENLIQAKAAAGRAAVLIGKPSLESHGVVAMVNPDRCAACLTCVRLCLFSAPKIKNYVAEIEPSICQGCGTCVDECPEQAISLQGYNDHIYLAMTRSLFTGAHIQKRKRMLDPRVGVDPQAVVELQAEVEQKAEAEPQPETEQKTESRPKAEFEPKAKVEQKAEFEPKIVGFCCHYCAYAAADLAGSLRLQYPPNIRIIEVPCSGDVGEQVIIQTFEYGADGVFVAGCLEGSCHFLQGNYHASKRVEVVKKILDEIGLSSERLEMYNLSSSMGKRFAEIAHEMTGRIRQLGPNPLSRIGNCRKGR
ncbi:MAG: hydrogenase iron-sulfur subunit [bacterium]